MHKKITKIDKMHYLYGKGIGTCKEPEIKGQIKILGGIYNE